MFGGLPQVGAQAVITNMAAFNQAANQVNRQLNIINRAAINLDRDSNHAFSAFGVGIAAAAVAGAAAIAGFSLKVSADLQRTAATVQAFGNASDREMADTAKSVRGLTREFTILPNDIATATKELVKGGASMEQINRSALAATVVLARTADEEISVSEAADRVTQSMTAFKLGQDEAMRVTNALVGAAQNSTATFSDLNVQLKQATPIASALGHSLEETTAVLAALNQSGLRGEVAGTAYKNMLIALIDPTDKAAKVLRDFNISLFDSNGKAMHARDIILQLNKAFGEQALASGKLTQQEQQRALSTIFSTRQIQAALTFLNQGVQAYDNALAAINSTASEEVARKLQHNLIDQATLVKNNMIALADAITSRLMPSLTNLGMTIVRSLQGVDDKPFERLGDAIARVIGLQDRFAASLTAKVLAGLLNLGAGIAALGSAIANALTKTVDWGSIWQGLADTFITVTAALRVIAERIAGLVNTQAAASQSTVQFADASLQGADIWARAFAIIADVTETVLTGIAKLVARVGIPALQALGHAGLFFHRAWTEIWTGIAEATGAALRDMARDIASFVNSLSSFVPDFLGILGVDVGKEIPGLAGLEQAGAALASFAASTRSNTIAGLKVAADGLDALTQSGQRLEAQAQATSDAWRESLKNFLGDIRTAAAESKTAADKMVADFARILAGSRDMEDAHDRLRRAMAANAKRDAAAVTQSPEPGFLPDEAGAEKKIPKGEQLKAFRELINGLLKDMPGLTSDLVDFMAGIAVDAPERLAPMVAAIRDSREQVIGLIGAKRSVLAIDSQLAQVEDRIAGLQLEANLVNIEQAQAMIGFDRQLLGLHQQTLEVDRQTWPIRDALEKIEREMNKLSRENLVLARQRIQTELEMMPLQKELADIQARIADTQRTNFDLEQRLLDVRAESLVHSRRIEDINRAIEARRISTVQLDRQALLLQQQMLPLKRQEAEFEDAITRLVDKRAQLTSRKNELTAEIDVDKIKDKLAGVNDELEGAWASFSNVDTIIALEQQKQALEDALKPAEKHLADIQKQQRDSNRETELASIAIQLQKVAVEELLDPLQRRLDIIKQTKEDIEIFNQIAIQGLEDQKMREEALLRTIEERDIALKRELEDWNLRNEVIRLGLEKEQQRLQDLLKPLQDKLDAINREITAENLRNQLAITHLEEERRKLEEQLIPLEDQRKAIERIIAEIEMQRSAAALTFEERKLQIQEQILAEQRVQAQLEITRRAQHAIFEQLVLDFLDSLQESKAFTASESVEVAKRLKFWDDQIGKTADLTLEMQRLETEANKVAQAIRDIPDRTVTVTTVYKTVVEGASAAPAAPAEGATPPQFAQGGLVPGPTGKPMLALLHGGEFVTPSRSVVPTSVQAGEARNVTNIANSTIYNYDIQMSPRYESIQSPARLKDDVNEILMSVQK